VFLCGALLVVPLLAIQMSSGAAAAQGRGGRAPVSTRPAGYLPAWQLAADRISTGQGGATTAAAVTQSAVPTTTPATVPPTTTPTAPPTTVPSPTTTTTTAPAPTTTTTTTPPAPAAEESGIVTYYDDPGGPGTCASPTLPFGTEVTITNPANGATVSCTVNDREADTARQIDLDTDSFAQIAPLSQGVIYGAGLSW
jgi:rare lipoprotein A (peptidoglycan hydrolase)